jgi:hypothetical protein
MLKGRLRKRLDRALFKGGALRLRGVEVVGREAVEGAAWEGRDVVPSDHYGLLVRLRREGS